MMNWNQVAGDWKQVKGIIQQQWGDLTDNDLTVINGQKNQLIGKLQERYGWTTEQAKRQLDDWLKKL